MKSRIMWPFAALIFVACTQLPTVPEKPDTPSERIALSWETKPERAAWSDALIGYVTEHFATLDTAKDITDFCSKYRSLTKAQKLKAWGELWVGTAYYESGFNPKSASVDVGTQSNKDTWSAGLLQMSVVDQKNYGIDFGYKYDDLLKPVPNLRLSMAILARQVGKRGLIVVPSSPYWAVLYRGKYDKVDEIAARVRKNAKFCN